ncbi:LIV-II [Alloiococcus otitis]|uniref:Branched-chain amino acid transport system carrier protein n=1 Tax=Alloiococcus otitis ATCC 51267 TaxID=883081 RepID=K9EV66_9LACT|nr:branched-chain amino acid transport system II carrier protein [Alloiococcus otitis]EKU93110.1 branched-chain amino acid transport system II carrier protein [Alloiococcus otitis ATCC 51267]SUU80744.1 LIV-II [Alloiococcus otitis]
MSKRARDVIIVGFALFAIFFGAGNLIFPVYLGLNAGDNWFSSMVGFILTDPFLAILVVIITAKLGGQAEDIGRRVGPNFAKVLGIIAILSIATFVAVPRTAATVHEIAIQPNFPNVSPVVTSLVFFAFTLYFVINEGKVIDIIGNILTPILIATLAIFIVWVIINPPGPTVPSQIESSDFLVGFTEGYQTMDALGANLMAGIVVTDLVRRGYTDKEKRYKNTIGVGIIAFILLSLVYGGLVYVGARFSAIYPVDMSRTQLLIASFSYIFGDFGAFLISVVVTLACLTTSVGLTATCGDYFQTISKNKLKYRPIVITSVTIGLLISLLSVDEIVAFTGPLLDLVYPVVMALALFSLFNEYLKYDLIFVGGVAGAFAVALIETSLGLLGMDAALESWTAFVPLAEVGFGWLIPALIGGLIGGLLGHFFDLGKRLEDHDNQRAVLSETSYT